MKTRLGILAVLVAASLCAVTSTKGEVDGAVHVGHTGDVRALCHARGVLWVGTGGGLYRYDVDRDRIIDHITAGPKLPSNSVRAIRAKGDSVLVGTDAGLSIFDGDATHVFRGRGRGVYDSLTFDHVRAIDLGIDDTIYLGTFGRGLGVMRPSGGRTITRTDSLLDDKVFGPIEVVREDGEKDFYCATSMGLCAYRDSAWVGFQAGAGIPRGEVRRILADGPDRFYMLVGVGGVYRFDRDRATRLTPAGVFPGDDIADLARDERGILWAAGRFGGLAVYQNGNWKRIGKGDPMIDAGRWRCAHTDGEGGAFFGSADGLVVSVRDNILRKHRIPIQLPAPSARSMVAGPREVRVLSGSRVVRVPLDLSSLTVDDSPPGLTALAADANGNLWASSRWGIYQGSGGAYREFVHDVDSPEPSFTTLCFDHAGRLWTATRAGDVYRYDGELWLHMAEPGELFPGPVDKVVVGCSSEGGEVVWTLSRGRGVAAFDGGTWTLHPADTLGGDVRDLDCGGGFAAVATARQVWAYDGGWLPVGLDGDGGVAVGGSVEAFVVPSSRPINCMRWGGNATVFLGTDGGLVALGKGGARWLGLSDGIGGEAVVDILVEGDEAIWVGFRSDGLTRIPVKSLW